MKTDLPEIQERPAALQINNSGAWKTVVTLDAGDEFQRLAAMRAVVMLSAITGAMDRTTWRIVTTGTPESLVLFHWSEATAWREKA